ncbi:hypothetical protein NDU88_008015 [Pleurodeles waltl]|uniref:Uncharacterized protein n=1 Tax=Pleurodeles waltl TaxID=8319 RepID=A0AAV7RVP6_PLEWA|nr:hypothetical protein NDU88_008015 [Pleurodeles waltl]
MYTVLLLLKNEGGPGLVLQAEWTHTKKPQELECVSEEGLLHASKKRTIIWLQPTYTGTSFLVNAKGLRNLYI